MLSPTSRRSTSPLSLGSLYFHITSLFISTAYFSRSVRRLNPKFDPVVLRCRSLFATLISAFISSLSSAAGPILSFVTAFHNQVHIINPTTHTSTPIDFIDLGIASSRRCKQQLITITRRRAAVARFSFSTLFFAQKENTVSTLGRAVLTIWLFVVLIIQSSYTASLTSILTVQQLSSPIKGIESLLTSNDPTGFQVGSFVENYLVEELGISRSRLRALDSKDDYIRTLNLGPKNGGVAAVVDERPYIELFLSSECNYAIVGSDFTRSGWGFAFQQDSQLAVDLSTVILKLSETGDLQRIHEQWFLATECESSSLGSDQLQLSSFWGLFLICGTACILALLIYFFLMLRQLVRHRPPPETDTHGSSRGRVVQTFLSFVDDKEDDARNRSKTRQITLSTNNSHDIER